VKVFFDEDTGASIGRALRAVDVDAAVVGRAKRDRVKPGTPDEIRLPWAASEGRLVLSRNSRMLQSDHQRQMLVAHRTGVVFLPQHVAPLPLLSLILKRWAWLELLFESETRPFAFSLAANGSALREDLLHYTPRRRRGAPRPQAPPAEAGGGPAQGRLFDVPE
jgi:hypothetical protein